MESNRSQVQLPFSCSPAFSAPRITVLQRHGDPLMRKAILFAAAASDPAGAARGRRRQRLLPRRLDRPGECGDRQSQRHIRGDDFDGDDTAFKLIAGIRPLDWLGVEAEYVNFGEPEDTCCGLTLRGRRRRHFRLRGRLPADRSGGPVREGRPDHLGHARSRRPSTTTAPTSPTASAHSSACSASPSAPSTRSSMSSDVDLDMISVGVTYTFL